MYSVILATNSKGKVLEFQTILSDSFRPHSINVEAIGEYIANFSVEENGTSFAENAIQKALTGFRLIGLPCLADDSGLCVRALDGEPGVKSARWLGGDASDSDRNSALLTRLSDVPIDLREASFVCDVALAISDDILLMGHGECRGRIACYQAGNEGFGYDSVFIPENADITMAELSQVEKNRISHRGAATIDLISKLSSEHMELICRKVAK